MGIDRAFNGTAEEYAKQAIGPRARDRIKIAYVRAAETIAADIEAGRLVRKDGFFDYVAADSARTAAEIVLTNVLQKARDDYEEKKADRLGELFAFIARRDDIRPAHGNRLVELAGRLTYQQLLWLGFFSLDETHRSGMRDWESTGAFTPDEQAFVGDTMELVQLGLLHRQDLRRVVDYTRLNPRQLKTLLDGALLVEGMSLTEAEPADVRALTAVLDRLGRLDGDVQSNRVETIGIPGTDPGSRVQLRYQAYRFQPIDESEL